MDENNNGFTPYKDFTEEGYDAVTDAANNLNEAATDAINSFTGKSPDSAATDNADAAPRQRNYERYLTEGEWHPTDTAPDNNSYAFGNDFDNFGNAPMNNEYLPTTPLRPDDSAVHIPEGLEEPMSMGEWIVTLLIMMVPCVNIIMMFVWAFSKTEKKSKSNFFKAELIFMGIIFGLYLIIFIVALVAGLATAFH